MVDKGRILVGIGGWTFEPWRGGFYPPGLPQKDELKFASRAVKAIEVNGTYYGSQKPESFARWRDESPDDFVFSVKGPRFTTNRRVLGEAGASVERFFGSGVLELKHKLGPINWQFLPTKTFEAADFEAFLRLLPRTIEGRVIRHVVEVRHASFATPGFVELIREYGIAAVLAESETFPAIADVTAPFVYARLQRTSETIQDGYSGEDLGTWADRANTWAAGGVPADLAWTGSQPTLEATPRDVFVFFIAGHKPKAPAAAQALIRMLGPAEPRESTLAAPAASGKTARGTRAPKPKG